MDSWHVCSANHFSEHSTVRSRTACATSRRPPSSAETCPPIWRTERRIPESGVVAGALSGVGERMIAVMQR